MAADLTAFHQEFKADQSRLRQEMPDLIKGFGGLYQASMKEGALSVKAKEVIAVAISMALRCEPCIYLHVKKALEVGATREELLEAAGVVVMMQGGPGYTYLPKLLQALDEG